MRASFRASGLSLFLLAASAAPAIAASIDIDGATAVLRQMGTSVQVNVTGAPGRPTYLLVDIVGPTTILGNAVPVGFSPFFIVVPVGVLSPSGTMSFSSTLPVDPTLEGRVIYTGVAIDDPSVAGGVDYSNGASIELTMKPFAIRALAGKASASFPFFQSVKAINQGDSIPIAIDPTIHPFVAGATAKLHVVATKSPATWDSDNTLVDVTNDGPNTVVLAATNIQSNTFIVDSGSLSGAAGDSIGVGFDVVIDLNSNDLLDAGDVIDGYSSEAGFYVVHDLTKPGPYAVTEVLYSGGTFLGQDLYYPANIASLGQLPLVVISHGNGHNYQWYDHIGNHLASYGAIVMSHQNNTGPGIETASTTTLTNTDYLLVNIATIAGGALVGHLDNQRIMWIGHSRGAEGICRAYDRIFDGTYTPTNFVLSDLKLLSSMAPTDFLGVNSANPHAVDYHLWTGEADADVNGCANNDIAQTFHLLERATKQRQSTSLHGVGHGDFHASTGSVASGPCLTGKPTAHLVIIGYFLALEKFHIEGNIPAEDFLSRQWEDLHPIGAPFSNPCVHVDLQYKESPDSGKYVIDDFQTQPATTIASSGATVAATVTNLVEGVMNDANADFTASATDTWNGFTLATASDTTRGAVFDFNGANASIAYSIPAPNRDFSSFDVLSFRTCQATRHALTTAVLGDLTFSVTLKDGLGNSSSINIGAHGGGVEEPYQRTTCGTGTGWGNEFETVRVRLNDFRTNGSGIELGVITTVEFDFGPSFGSAQGRLGLDDVELTKN